jgi:hypothetical protein
MHAVLTAVTVEGGHEDEGRALLAEKIVPAVRELPGAIAGYWLEPQPGQGYSTVVFDTEENAKAAAELVPARLPDFVTPNLVQVQEVIAHF